MESLGLDSFNGSKFFFQVGVKLGKFEIDKFGSDFDGGGDNYSVVRKIIGELFGGESGGRELNEIAEISHNEVSVDGLAVIYGDVLLDFG